MSNLDSLISETVNQYRQDQETQKKLALEKKRLAERLAEQELQNVLAEFLMSDFLSSIELKFHHRYEYNGKSHYLSAYFPFMGVNWHLMYQHGGMHNGWSIYTSRIENLCSTSTKANSIDSSNLQTVLLVNLGEHKKEVEEAERSRSAHLRQIEIDNQRREEYEREHDKQRAEQIAEEEREHQRLTELFEEAKEKALKKMWRWPDGVTIEIYYLEYCKGAIRGEDGNTSFDYDGDWTTASALDDLGRIRLELAKQYSSSNSLSKVHVVQLIPELHLPRWEVHQASSVEALPKSLRLPVKVSLHGVVHRCSRLDNKSRLMEDEMNFDEHWYEQQVGEEPLQWVKDLVEQSSSK